MLKNFLCLVWFVPISGFICAACQTFVVNEGQFENHANEKSHKDNVDKFKRILVSLIAQQVSCNPFVSG